MCVVMTCWQACLTQCYRSQSWWPWLQLLHQMPVQLVSTLLHTISSLCLKQPQTTPNICSHISAVGVAAMSLEILRVIYSCFSNIDTVNFILSCCCVWFIKILLCAAQLSIPPGSVNEYQLWLRRQRQVWFISLTDERRVCR